ncbi:hypothetical protein [Curtobacterium sp. KT1]|uniref:hypothetical protein n=1 Tax=Curtobacterium sp. KT1 TaxID=3372858 RepID=UPI0037BFB416
MARVAESRINFQARDEGAVISTSIAERVLDADSVFPGSGCAVPGSLGLWVGDGSGCSGVFD